MRVPTRRTALLAGIALILLTNAVALGGVWWNRSGEPDSVLALSERELSVDAGLRSESSGLALAMEWRVVPYVDPDESLQAWFWADRGGSPGWLDRDKMRALGFAPIVDADQRRRSRQQSREVLVVFELDGPVYRAYAEQMQARAEHDIAQGQLHPESRELVQRADRAREYLKAESRRSRLFAVDAGLNRAELRAAYPDRSRHAIVRGKVTPAYSTGNTKGPQGYIHPLLVGSVHVPYAHRKVFESVGYADSGTPRAAPAFVAEVAFGSRLEPWLRSVRATAQP